MGKLGKNFERRNLVVYGRHPDDRANSVVVALSTQQPIDPDGQNHVLNRLRQGFEPPISPLPLGVFENRFP